MKNNMTAHDCVHFLVAVMFFGYIILLGFHITQGTWPTRAEVGMTGFVLMGGAAMGLAAVWWLGDDDKTPFK